MNWVQFLFSSSRRRPGPRCAEGTRLRRCDKIDVGTSREGSKYGIEEFLEVKYLSIGGIDR